MQRLQLNNLLGGVIAGFLAIPESMAYAGVFRRELAYNRHRTCPRAPLLHVYH